MKVLVSQTIALLGVDVSWLLIGILLDSELLIKGKENTKTHLVLMSSRYSVAQTSAPPMPTQRAPIATTVFAANGFDGTCQCRTRLNPGCLMPDC